MDSLYIFLLFIITLVAVLYLLTIFLSKFSKELPWPYRAKKFFFSRSEQQFLQVLNDSIDHRRYTIFPKVRLADFIEVTVKGKEYQSHWNRIRSKHVDYLVWDIQKQTIALAVELDGKSHKSEKMQERDAFVEKLYETIAIPLERIDAGGNYQEQMAKINNRLQTSHEPQSVTHQ